MSIEYDTQLAPTANAYDVQTFLDAWHSDPRTLVLQPPFQRNMVWNNDQRSYLIDSILRGLPVPELYLQKTTSPDGGKEIVVVDGQQRISACIDYALGKYALSTTKTDLDSRWSGKFFDDLEPTLRGKFRDFNFIGRQLPSSLSDPALREIFQRLNRTVEALEPQELRHAAYTGEFIQLVEAASEVHGLQELGVFSPKDIQRRRHDTFVSEVFFASLLKTFPNKKDGLDDHYMIFERQGMPEEGRADLIQRFGRATRFLSAHGATLKKTRFRNKSDAYSLLVFLISHAKNLPVSDSSAESIVEHLEKFSTLVNQIKKAETAGESVDYLTQLAFGEDASLYLHAVERAASDRQNRIRRNTALESVLSPLFSTFPETSFTAEDEAWRHPETDISGDSIDDFDSVEDELVEVRRVLTDEEND